MARMHSRKKGKSRSKKPARKVKPIWVGYTPKETEQLVLKLARAKKTTSEIGIILRDSYGIPNVKQVTNKSITKILKENKLAPELPYDMQALIKKSIAISKHRESNRKDMTAKRGMQLTESKILRLAKYYKRTKRLPQEWTFDSTKAKLLLE